MIHSGFEIVKAGENDLMALQLISRSTFFDSYHKVNTEENMRIYLEVNFGEEQLGRELQDKASEFYFAMNNETPVGYLKINFEKAHTVKGYPNTLEIERIYVSKDLQGKSIGKLLLNKAIEITKQQRLRFL